MLETNRVESKGKHTIIYNRGVGPQNNFSTFLGIKANTIFLIFMVFVIKKINYTNFFYLFS